MSGQKTELLNYKVLLGLDQSKGFLVECSQKKRCFWVFLVKKYHVKHISRGDFDFKPKPSHIFCVYVAAKILVRQLVLTEREHLWQRKWEHPSSIQSVTGSAKSFNQRTFVLVRIGFTHLGFKRCSSVQTTAFLSWRHACGFIKQTFRGKNEC